MYTRIRKGEKNKYLIGQRVRQTSRNDQVQGKRKSKDFADVREIALRRTH